jgi:glycosyltransferase involved in cell wall biosynthesis
MLREVLASLRGSGLRFSVISLIDDLSVGRQLAELGIPVSTLGLQAGAADPRGLWRLVHRLRRDPPDVLQTWLYHADLLGLLAARWAGRPPVIWNIRHATLTPGVDSRSTRWTAAVCARLSARGPYAIVVNSRRGEQVHREHGYAPERFHWIPNGFDLQRFRPSPAARRQLRQELGLPEETPLIGLAARWSPLKGHQQFIAAMTRLAWKNTAARFVLCGRGTDRTNEELTRQIDAAGFAERWRLLGPRDDMPLVHAALDVAVCPSISEAFSNSLGEALACGVPCVATDVGDSPSLVGDAGKIVPVNDVPALGDACLELLEATASERAGLSRRARRRMEDHYDIRHVAEQYRRLWWSAAAAQGKPFVAAAPSPGRQERSAA